MRNLEHKLLKREKLQLINSNPESLISKTLPEIELESLLLDISKTFELSGLNEEIFPGTFLLHTPKDILQAMNLRSKVFTPLGYNKEFPEKIKGLNYDEFDEKSLILGYKRNGCITGSIRIILDNHNKLQTDSKLNLDPIRKKGKIAELSRLVVDPRFQEKGIEFKNLFAGVYLAGKGIEIKNYILSILDKHKHLYDRFGDITEIYSGSYGSISTECSILSWGLNNPSKMFLRGFLKNV